ncbi:MAG TPA: TetR/AcrR family transcriptional regulator [Acidimicrobiales bacterium]|nr:TetR/AcrR family transcriptional regulator [Acidimicrobiales bacterium]
MGPARGRGTLSGRRAVSAPGTAGRADGRRAAKAANAPVTGEPASKRALRTQGRKTMRKLLDAAMVVFNRRGYHAARVDDIVKVARTSHGTFYLYFSNKEDLLRALVAEAGEEVAALDHALGPVSADDAGWHELRQWMERFSEAWQKYAPILRAWTDLVMSDTELTAQAHAAAGGVANTLAQRIDQAGPQPGIDPNAAAEAVVAMVDRFHYLRQFAGEPIDAAALDTLTTMVHRALFGGGDPPAGSSRNGRTRASSGGRSEGADGRTSGRAKKSR